MALRKGISDTDPHTACIRPDRLVRMCFIIQRGTPSVRAAGPDVLFPANRGDSQASGPLPHTRLTPRTHPKPSPALSLQRMRRFPHRIHASPKAQRPTLVPRDVIGREGSVDRCNQTGDAASMRMRRPEKPTPAAALMRSPGRSYLSTALAPSTSASHSPLHISVHLRLFPLPPLNGDGQVLGLDTGGRVQIRLWIDQSQLQKGT